MSHQSMVVLTPSRNRPRELNELMHNVTFTTNGRAYVLGLVDADDPQRAVYKSLSGAVWIGEPKGLAAWTNYAAQQLTYSGPLRPEYLATLGDDHRARTPNWDIMLTDAIRGLDGPGVAYGNDLYQGERLCTAWVMHVAAYQALGWMMLPRLNHMYVDTAMMDVAHEAQRLAYVPNVIIEHMHPLAGKADWDETYRATNTPAAYREDERAYRLWRTSPDFTSAVKALSSTRWGDET